MIQKEKNVKSIYNQMLNYISKSELRLMSPFSREFRFNPTTVSDLKPAGISK
jgi:hypothetical protein